MRDRQRAFRREVCVNIIFDDGNLLCRSDFGYGCTACGAHRRCRRVMQRRYGEERRHARAATSAGKGFGDQSFVVDFDRHDAATEHQRLCGDGVIGEAFGKDQIAGFGRREYGCEYRLLRARAENNILC